MYCDGLTGKGIRVAVIDSGVNPAHPHVGGVAGAVSFAGPGYLDCLGHGTAVAGAIREKAPDAEIYAVKVFDRTLSTGVQTLLRALDWCLEREMDLINLSLGTLALERLRPALERSLVVGPRGCGTIPVGLDWLCPRNAYRWDGETFLASGYPRPVPGVPPDRNLSGLSFAVANMTGFAARARQACTPAELRSRLIAEAGSP